MTAQTSKKMLAVARECGVSPMTVSRALRHDGVVAESTRRRVRAAAARLGYHPDTRMGRPRPAPRMARPVVQVIFGEALAPLNLFQTQLLFLLERELARRGCDCLVRTCGGDYDEFIALCEALRTTAAAGSLVTGFFPPERLETLLGLTSCAVLVDYAGMPQLRRVFEYVSFDNVEAARLVIRHLLERRRRILLVRGAAGHYFADEMERGYRAALAEAGLSAEPDLIQCADFTAAGAWECLRAVLARRLDFDAVFTNDEMALGVLRALHEAGRKVPDDVAVAGCDGLSFGACTIPPLTTIRLDLPLMARLAVERVAARMAGAPPACRTRLLPELEVRGSS